MIAETMPLVSTEVDLRDFAFMPLDVVRLRDSGLTAKATGDEFRAAVLLWCASWHQVPAASLPNDDAELANLCGYGRALREWRRVRDGAMRGWVLCSDGRLYHPIIAEKARDAWQSKLAQRARTEAARRAREAARQSKSQSLLQTAQVSVTDIVTASKGQGQGQGQGIKEKEQTLATAFPDAEGGTSPGALSRALRERGIESNPMEPRMLAFAAAGITPKLAAAAADEARRSKGEGVRIPPGYVYSILDRWLSDPSSRPASAYDPDAVAAEAIRIMAERGQHATQ